MSERRILEFVEQVASNPSNTTLNQFDKYLAEGSLILRPPFQRNLVWNDEQRSFLVDSVLRGLPVPEVYVQSDTTAEGDERVVVVDGQQRISACLSFLQNDLRLSEHGDLDPRWRGCTFEELDPGLQKRFRSYYLIVRKLPDLGDTILREVFRRLNKTVEPLNPQELRHAAYTGRFLRFVEAAASHSVFSDVGVFSPRDYLRRKSDELVGEMAFAVASGAYPNKKEGLDELFLTFERRGVPDDTWHDLVRRFGRVLDELNELGAALKKTRFRNKSDFYTLFIVLCRRAEVLPLTPQQSTTLMSELQVFSDAVNEFRKIEMEPEALDEALKGMRGEAEVQYLRAVERAASDRLSRVRRDEALSTAIGSILEGEEKPLTAVDEEWLAEILQKESEEEAAEGSEDAAEKEHAEEVLRTADD